MLACSRWSDWIRRCHAPQHGWVQSACIVAAHATAAYTRGSCTSNSAPPCPAAAQRHIMGQVSVPHTQASQLVWLRLVECWLIACSRRCAHQFVRAIAPGPASMPHAANLPVVVCRMHSKYVYVVNSPSVRLHLSSERGGGGGRHHGPAAGAGGRARHQHAAHRERGGGAYPEVGTPPLNDGVVFLVRMCFTRRGGGPRLCCLGLWGAAACSAP